MSPEQARGEEADARSDVWALGIVMYEMLAGSVPFRGTYPEATFHAIKNEPLPSLRAVRPEVPETLERIVMRALDKDPAKRFQTAREPARDLKLLAGRTVPLDLQTVEVPRPAGVGAELLRKQSSARRVTPTRAAISVAALLALAVGTYFWLTRPVERLRVAIVPVINQTGFAELDPYRLALTQTLLLESGDSTRVRVVPYDRVLETLRRFLAGGADMSSRDAVQALTSASAVQIVVIPTLVYENSAWRARGEVRDPATMTNLAVVETDPMISSLTKKAGYELMGALATRLDEHFVQAGPRKLRWLDSLRSMMGRQRPPISPRFRDVDAAAAFEEGTNKFQQLEYASARDAFEEATKADPQAPLAFAWLARTSQILQQIDASQQAAAQALRWLRPETPAGDAVLIHAIDAEVRHDSKAEAQYRGAVQTYVDDPSWLIELAAFHDRQARSSDAISTYQRALAMDQAQPGVHLELCRLYGRTNEPAKARQEGDAARSTFRSLGNRAGEALALMCLTNVLRLGDPARQEEARRDAAAAVAILEREEAPYNLARAQYYVALAAESQGPAVAISSYETALGKARSSANVVLEPLVLMNLGALYSRVGRQSGALDYFRQSLSLYERFGDERRVAQLHSNIGSILIEYGGRPEEGLRDIQNSQAIFRKLGDRDFETYTSRLTALAQQYGGRLIDSEKELNKAISLAKERDLRDRLQILLVYLARSRFQLADYVSARNQLTEAFGDGTGENATLAIVTLGRVQSRLGDFSAAKATLERASRDVQSSGNVWLEPSIFEALGELAYGAGLSSEARASFSSASRLWVDELPEPASVESRAYLGLLDAEEGQIARGRAEVQASLRQARKMRIYGLEARCTLLLAQVALLDHRKDEALDLLSRIPPDGDRAIGPELQAQVHMWRARARGGASPDPDMIVARQLLDTIRSGLPDPERRNYSMRLDLGPIDRDHPVR